MIWRLAGGRTLPLDRPRVMAILNATPDSFSDGGTHLDPLAAAASAARFASEGADMLDVGGESTRPGAARVPAEEQIARVVPVIRAIRGAGITLPVSVDTTLSPVAEAALRAGADAINDVSGGEEDPAIVDLAVRTGAGLILMHRLRPPGADAFSDRYGAADRPSYDDVVRAGRDCFESFGRDRTGCRPYGDRGRSGPGFRQDGRAESRTGPPDRGTGRDGLPHAGRREPEELRGAGADAGRFSRAAPRG